MSNTIPKSRAMTVLANESAKYSKRLAAKLFTNSVAEVVTQSTGLTNSSAIESVKKLIEDNFASSESFAKVLAVGEEEKVPTTMAESLAVEAFIAARQAGVAISANIKTNHIDNGTHTTVENVEFNADLNLSFENYELPTAVADRYFRAIGDYITEEGSDIIAMVQKDVEESIKDTSEKMAAASEIIAKVKEVEAKVKEEQSALGTAEIVADGAKVVKAPNASAIEATTPNEDGSGSAEDGTVDVGTPPAEGAATEGTTPSGDGSGSAEDGTVDIGTAPTEGSEGFTADQHKMKFTTKEAINAAIPSTYIRLKMDLDAGRCTEDAIVKLCHYIDSKEGDSLAANESIIQSRLVMIDKSGHEVEGFDPDKSKAFNDMVVNGIGRYKNILKSIGVAGIDLNGGICGVPDKTSLLGTAELYNYFEEGTPKTLKTKEITVKMATNPLSVESDKDYITVACAIGALESEMSAVMTEVGFETVNLAQVHAEEAMNDYLGSVENATHRTRLNNFRSGIKMGMRDGMGEFFKSTESDVSPLRKSYFKTAQIVDKSVFVSIENTIVDVKASLESKYGKGKYDSLVETYFGDITKPTLNHSNAYEVFAFQYAAKLATDEVGTESVDLAGDRGEAVSLFAKTMASAIGTLEAMKIVDKASIKTLLYNAAEGK